MASSPVPPVGVPTVHALHQKYHILPSDLRDVISNNVCHGAVSQDSQDYVERWCDRFRGITSEDVYSVAVKTAFGKTSAEINNIFKSHNQQLPRANYWRNAFKLLCETQ